MSLFGDINEVRIMGNLTSDPELRYTANGTPVANFSVATNRRYKVGEEWKDEVEYHNVVIFGNLADSFGKRTHKGTRVQIVGRLRTSSWDGQDGQKKYKTEIIADDAFLIDRYEKGRNDELASPEYAQDTGGEEVPMNQQPAPGGTPPQNNTSKSGAKREDIIDPDDLPF